MVTGGHGIEAIERPVEFIEVRPGEMAGGVIVIGTVGQQEIASLKEAGCTGQGHRS